MVDVATLQAQLADAQAALHRLMTGQAVVEIRHGQNEQMTFQKTDVGALRAYINDLSGQLVAAGASTTGGRPRGRRVAF